MDLVVGNGETLHKIIDRYPDLWALQDRTRVCWEIAGREFADRLSNKLNQRVTTDDVKQKVLLIKASFKKLNKTQGTARTTLCTYLWYAHKLGLKHAANRLTKQLISDGKIKPKIETDTVDFLGFDEGEQEITGEHTPQVEVMDEITGEQTPQVEVMDGADRLIEEEMDEIMGEQTPINVQSDSVYSSGISSVWSPMSTARTSHKYIQPEKSCIQKYKEVVDVWPDVEALREFVKS
uniref:MADF domain-containing protein n=1 Tax=Glossina austeni TaxID=7395 RepID=A0A1A9UER5_GLOAU